MCLVKRKKTSLGSLFQFFNPCQLYKGLKWLLWVTWFTNHINSIGRETFHVIACFCVIILFDQVIGTEPFSFLYTVGCHSSGETTRDLTINSKKIIDNGDLIKQLLQYRSYDSQPSHIHLIVRRYKDIRLEVYVNNCRKNCTYLIMSRN